MAVEPEQKVFMGVDYGAKLAGTTAVAMRVQEKLQVWQSVRGQDADAWLTSLIRSFQPKYVFIDAPLSLPAVYTCSGTLPAEADYFYRGSDRLLQAMSPMFLGGLTARAMKLKAELETTAIKVLETYPAQLARQRFSHLEGYKKGAAPPQAFTNALLREIGFGVTQPLANWHQVDAVLAWYSGYRYLQGKADVYGDATEGQIVV